MTLIKSKNRYSDASITRYRGPFFEHWGLRYYLSTRGREGLEKQICENKILKNWDDILRGSELYNHYPDSFSRKLYHAMFLDHWIYF